MKKILQTAAMVCLLCLGYGPDGFSQSLQKLEFAFDADPGIGNGAVIALPAADIVDSLFTLDVSGLSTGLHTIFYRVQDNTNKWSFTQKGSFIKLPGNDTALSIVQIEYFVDVDPGFGNGTQLQFTPGNDVSQLFDLYIPDNGNDFRKVYVRAKDNRGFWSLLSATEVNMCNLYKAHPEFGFVQFGNQFTFIDSTRPAPGKYEWKYFNNGNQIGTDTIVNPQLNLPAGLNRVRLIAGKGCRKDSVDIPLTVNRIEDYRPRSSAAGGNVIINLFGAGLDNNAQLSLVPVNGGTAITPYEKRRGNNYQLNAMFDFHNVTSVGDYHLIVQFSSGVKDTVPYKIYPADTAANPGLWVYRFGSGILRAGVPGDYVVLITNPSRVLARGVPLFIAVPDYVGVYLPQPYIAPPIPGFADSVLPYVRIDSFQGKPIPVRIYGIIVPNVNPGSTVAIRLKLLHFNSSNPVMKMTTWTHSPLFGSPLKYAVGNCLDGIIMTGLGFTPLGCISAGFDFVYNVTEQVVWGEQNYSGWGNYVWAIASTAISCVPGGSLAAAYGRAQETIDFYNDMGRIADASINAHNGSKSFIKDCLGLDQNNQQDKDFLLINSRDPNAIYGPGGYNTPQWIQNKGKAGYMISFENVAAATGNAQQVFIYDTLDKDKFDLSTFELGDFTIGDSAYTVPSYRQEYAKIVSVKGQPNVQVLYTAKLDTATGIVRHGFYSIDPVSKNLVDSNSVLGFLPPNTTAPNGEGSVSYYVQYKPDLPTGTQISKRAGIVFDRNEEILTNTWVNTVDTTRPLSNIVAATKINDTTARLVFNGADVGAGVRQYELYVSENGRPFNYFGLADKDTVLLHGSMDSTYSFYVKAIDQVNNVEIKPPIAEASLTFAGPLPVNMLPLQGKRHGNSNVLTWTTLTETNNRGFFVERSTDGSNYLPLAFAGTQAFLGNSISKLDYSFTDSIPPQKAFYRLQQLDLDNKKSYSNVVRIDREKIVNLNIYPNPASGYVYVLSDKTIKQIQILDMNGRVVKSTGSQPYGKYDISSLTPGVYIFHVFFNEGVETIKFIIGDKK